MDMNPQNSRVILKKIGFLAGYLLFNTIAFLILKVTNKIPESYTWYHMIPFTLFILLLGILIKQTIKK